MLPGDATPFPQRKDFQLHAAMVPAKEVGGDLFDFFLLDDHHLAFVIGDVSGKGVPAALFMAVARTLLRATAQNQKQPAECFTYMNTTLCEGNEMNMYVTLFYGVLDTRTGEIEFANGGHNPPLVVSPDGKLRKLTGKSGPFIGFLEEQQYRGQATRLAPGEAILLYTDGVTEALDKHNEFFGDERLESFLTGHATDEPRNLVLGLHSAVQEFSGHARQADDITVLALRYLGSPQ